MNLFFFFFKDFQRNSYWFFVFCFFKFYLFIYLWLCWVFVSVRGLSLVAASGGHSSSRCAGLSLSWPLLLRSTSSRRSGSAIVAHGPSCSAACGIFPDQGSNPCPLHWQADSQPLRHQGSPVVNLWRRRVGAPFGPFPVDNYIVQRYLKFAKFWVSVLNLLFQMWSLVQYSLVQSVNCTTICEVGQHRRLALTPTSLSLPLFYWSSSPTVFPSWKSLPFVLPML